MTLSTDYSSESVLHRIRKASVGTIHDVLQWSGPAEQCLELHRSLIGNRVRSIIWNRGPQAIVWALNAKNFHWIAGFSEPGNIILDKRSLLLTELSVPEYPCESYFGLPFYAEEFESSLQRWIDDLNKREADYPHLLVGMGAWGNRGLAWRAYQTLWAESKLKREDTVLRRCDKDG